MAMEVLGLGGIRRALCEWRGRGNRCRGHDGTGDERVEVVVLLDSRPELLHACRDPGHHSVGEDVHGRVRCRRSRWARQRRTRVGAGDAQTHALGASHRGEEEERRLQERQAGGGLDRDVALADVPSEVRRGAAEAVVVRLRRGRLVLLVPRPGFSRLRVILPHRDTRVVRQSRLRAVATLARGPWRGRGRGRRQRRCRAQRGGGARGSAEFRGGARRLDGGGTGNDGQVVLTRVVRVVHLNDLRGLVAQRVEKQDVCGRGAGEQSSQAGHVRQLGGAAKAQ